MAGYANPVHLLVVVVTPKWPVTVNVAFMANAGEAPSARMAIANRTISLRMILSPLAVDP
jgi:hypothetical protein